MRPAFQLGSQLLTVEPTRFHGSTNFSFTLAGKAFTVSLLSASDDASAPMKLELNGVTHRLHVVRQHDTVYLHVGGKTYQLDQIDPLERLLGADSADNSISAPMPGVVVELRATEGESVKAGDTLIVIESMKLLSEIRAPRDGVVENLLVGSGDSFEKGAVLAELSPIDADSDSNAKTNDGEA